MTEKPIIFGTRAISGLSVGSSSTEVNHDIRPPPHVVIQSIQISGWHTYPVYVRVEYYYDPSDEYPEILFANWLRPTSGHFNAPSIVLNKRVYGEKGILRIAFLNESGTTITPMVIVNYGDEQTNQQTYYGDFEHFGVWAYNDMIERHTSAGIIDITITPVEGSWFELYVLQLTAGMTAAEDITVEYRDENNATIEVILEDNTQLGTIRGPYKTVHASTAVASTPESIGAAEDVMRIVYPDNLHIVTSSCTATDDLNITLRARLKDRIPTITLGTNNQHQAAYTTNYSKVI